MGTQTKKITLDTAAILVGRVVGLLLGVIRLNILATYLGLTNFGILNFAAYFAALFQSLFDLGFPQLLTREIARTPEKSRDLLGKAVILKIGVAFISSVLLGCVALASRFDADTNWAILLTTAGAAITSISATFLSALQAHRKMILVAVTSIATDLLLSTTVILLVPAFPGITVVLLLTAAAACLNLAALATTYVRVVGMPKFGYDSRMWTLLLKDGATLAVSSLGISIYTFIGPTILKYTRPQEEMGLFSAGYRLITILTFIPTAFTQVIYPVFSGFQATAPQKLHKALEDSLRVMVQISLPLAAGSFILAPQIMAFLFPPEYASAAVVLRIISAGIAVGYLAWILYSFLIAVNRQTFCMWNSLGVALLVFSSNMMLVPVFGYTAVAWITMATELVLFLSSVLYVRHIGYPIRGIMVYAKVLVAAAVMAGALILMRDLPLVVTVVCGGLVYSSMLYFLHTFGDQERELLSRILQR